MRQWLACLALGMATTAAWAAALEPITVQYAYQAPSAQDAFRQGESVFIEPRLAKSWGWNVDLRGSEVQVATEGRVFRVPALSANGRVYLDLTESARFLGADTRWQGDTFQVLGRVRSIEATERGVQIDSTIRVRPRVFKLTNPDRLVIDLAGARLDLPEEPGFPSWWRAAQFGPDTARLVIEHPGVPAVPLPQLEPARRLEVLLPAVARMEPSQVTGPVAPVVVAPQGGTRQGSVADPIVVQAPVVVRSDERSLQLRLDASRGMGTAPAVRYVSPTQIQVTVAGATFVTSDSGQLPGTSWVKSYVTTGDGRNAVLILETPRPMAFTVAARGQSVFLTLTAPTAGAGLEGRVIVIDPGHGGRDSGARFGQVWEKHLVLRYGQRLRDELTKAGASVIMTRDDDTYPSLGARAQLANDSRADLFLSLHVNSLRLVNGRSGGMTFFHQQDAVDRLLAECIQSEIAKVSNIPDMGAWSDRRIHQSGFKVLRDSQVPSVLIEFGFINHDHDRAEMTKPDFADRMARAIVRGIRLFLGEMQ